MTDAIATQENDEQYAAREHWAPERDTDVARESEDGLNRYYQGIMRRGAVTARSWVRLRQAFDFPVLGQPLFF